MISAGKDIGGKVTRPRRALERSNRSPLPNPQTIKAGVRGVQFIILMGGIRGVDKGSISSSAGRKQRRTNQTRIQLEAGLHASLDYLLRPWRKRRHDEIVDPPRAGKQPLILPGYKKESRGSAGLGTLSYRRGLAAIAAVRRAKAKYGYPC